MAKSKKGSKKSSKKNKRLTRRNKKRLALVGLFGTTGMWIFISSLVVLAVLLVMGAYYVYKKKKTGKTQQLLGNEPSNNPINVDLD